MGVFNKYLFTTFLSVIKVCMSANLLKKSYCLFVQLFIFIISRSISSNNLSIADYYLFIKL